MQSNMYSTKRLVLFVMFIILLVWILAYPIARSLPDEFFKDPVSPIYNGLNVLFTALAFGGLIVTLIIQVNDAKIARRESLEKSIFELFQIFTAVDFQVVKDSAYRVLLASVKDKDYAEFVASRLFVIEQLPLPISSNATLTSLDINKKDLDYNSLVNSDRADRLMLDNILNFFALLAQRESSSMVIKHCDFAYDWWRPVLWIIAQLQADRYKGSQKIQYYCKNQLIVTTLKTLDQIYGHTPLDSSEDVWKYISNHPKLLDFELDARFLAKAK